MQYKEREKLISQIWKRLYHIRKTKGKDYSGFEDCNANFKKAGKKYKVSPEKALAILMDKHLDAIATFINEGSLQGEPVQDKILDCINYLLILTSLIVESKNTKTNGH